MIYGEEALEVDFSKGLWLNDTKDTPEGYCTELKNLILTPNKELEIRPSFISVFPTDYGASPTYLYASDGVLDTRTYYPMLSLGTSLSRLNPEYRSSNVPLIIEHIDRISNGQLAVLNNTPTAGNIMSGRVNRITTTFIVTTKFVQYRDRIYLGKDTGIHSISGFLFDGTNPYLTENLIAASPTLSVASYAACPFFVHKDRLFVCRANRVYFTEPAALGGYPETWNTASNFIDLPVDFIYAAYEINNTLYFFTGRGTYSLQTYGPPSSWIIKVLDPEISIAGPQEVALAQMSSDRYSNTGVFYFVNKKQIYIYNGETSIKISHPVEDELYRANSISIFPYENGIIVSLLYYARYDSGPLDFAVVDSTRVLYFDGEIWSEITMKGYPFIVVQDTLVNVPSRISDETPTTYITFLYGTSRTSWDKNTFYVSRKSCIGDALTLDTPSLDIEASFSTKYIEQAAIKEKRFKHGYIDLYSQLDNITIETEAEDGQSTSDVYNTPQDIRGLTLNSNTGAYIYTPDKASLRLTAGFRAVFKMKADDYTVAAGPNVFSKRSSVSTQQAFRVFLNSSGRFIVSIWPTGSGAATTTSQTSGSALVDGTTYWFRLTYVGDNGAGQRVFTVDRAADNDSYEPPSSWTNIQTIISYGTALAFSGTDSFVIGATSDGLNGFIGATFYRFILQDHTGTTTVLDWDARKLMPSSGGSGYTDSYGNLWAATGNYTFNYSNKFKNFFLKFKCSFFGRKALFRFSKTRPYLNSYDTYTVYPSPLKFKKMYLVYNTSRNEENETAG